MNTITKFLAASAAVLVLAGCSAVAEEKTATPATGPGWRHEQMVKAWEKGEMPGPMMMQGRGGMGPGMMRGAGPGAQALGPDGKVDTSKLPPWCPLSTAPDATKTTK